MAVLVMPAVADEVDDLILDLKYGTTDVREEAAYALGEIGDPRAVEPLNYLVSKNENMDVRDAAKEALKKLEV
ncbi:MAG: HEAT repeat domain-containing protein [Methanotrichaceae archaeon]